ncbi:isochorismate synthase, partial [Streptomyces sp. NPDC047072]
MSLTTHAPAEPLVTPGAATSLLDAYRPATDRFLATPHRTLLGRGTAAEVPDGAGPLAHRVRDVLDALRRPDAPAPVVIGSLPFAPDAPTALAVPDLTHSAPPLREDPLLALPVPHPARRPDWQVREVPTPEHYGRAVADVVARMRAGEFN